MSDELFAEYWSLVAVGETGAAAGLVVREYEAGVALPVLLDLVSRAQAEVGRLWAENRWSIAQEHRATSVSEEVIGALTSRIDAPPTNRTVLVTCTDGEWHALPSKVLAAALRGAGHQVTFLGASVPARQLGQLLHDVGPDVTAISCALPTRLPDARQMIETSREAGIPVIVGGRGFGVDETWAVTLGAHAWAPDARGALELVEPGALPAFATPAPPLTWPDDAITALRTRHRDIVDRSMDEMTARMPDVARYSSHQLERTREDIGHIVDFLSAALFVDDVRLFTEFCRWLGEILVARDVPLSSLRAGLRVVAATIASEPGPYERTLSYLSAGAEQLR